MHIILLTSADDDMRKPYTLYLVVEHIVSMSRHPDDHYTVITSTGPTVDRVRETPQEIIQRVQCGPYRKDSE